MTIDSLKQHYSIGEVNKIVVEYEVWIEGIGVSLSGVGIAIRKGFGGKYTLPVVSEQTLLLLPT
jgi:hypothetical protein